MLLLFITLFFSSKDMFKTKGVKLKFEKGFQRNQNTGGTVSADPAGVIVLFFSNCFMASILLTHVASWFVL